MKNAITIGKPNISRATPITGGAPPPGTELL